MTVVKRGDALRHRDYHRLDRHLGDIFHNSLGVAFAAGRQQVDGHLAERLQARRAMRQIGLQRGEAVRSRLFGQRRLQPGDRPVEIRLRLALGEFAARQPGLIRIAFEQTGAGFSLGSFAS